METKTLSPIETNRTIRVLYVSTMLYGIGDILFLNSFMLLYFSMLGLANERILFYLALPSFIRILSLVPFAHWAERIGKVRLGIIGLSMGSIALLLIAGAGSVPPAAAEPLIASAMIILGLGSGLYLNSWFPLIATIIPEARRGRFFGTMRFLYTAVAIGFTFIASWTLERHSAIIVFQIFLAITIVLRVIGCVFYGRIPELERHLDQSRTMIRSLLSAVGTSGFLPFCSYVFLLSLFTGACTPLFSLLAKDSLALPQNQVLLIGNLSTFGSLLGFFFGGTLVDRIGTKHVFVICHLTFALVLLLFLVRDSVPIPAVGVVGFLALSFGLVQAASGVAMSSEMLAVIPTDNKPMATAINLSLTGLGVALAGMCSSAILKLGILNPTWTLFGNTLGPYDSLLLFCGVMVLLLVVTLGLVPSVVKRVQHA